MKLQYRILALISSWLSGWIPVKRKLPQHKNKGVMLGIVCFTLLNGSYPAVCVFLPYDKRWLDTNGHRDVTEWVTHWKSSEVPSIFFDEWMIDERIKRMKDGEG